jgi:ABC-type transporter Mla subunit MlaD
MNDEEQKYVPKVGLNITGNKKAIGYEKAHQPAPKDLKESVQNKINTNIQTGNEIVGVMKEFVSILRDKTLLEEKHPNKPGEELAVLNKLIETARKINIDALNSEVNDSSDLDNGTMALLGFLLKALIENRNRLNKQEKQIVDLTLKLNALSKELGITYQ